MWALIEARKVPAVSERIGNRYDENVRRGINWFLGTYNERLGWVQNPTRLGQTNRLDGLTAQILFILSQAESVEPFTFIKSEQAYLNVKRAFIQNEELAKRTIEQNSNTPDPDQRFPDTDFQAEGTTFLWFPWTLATLTQLAADGSLSATDRKNAAELRSKILQNNASVLEGYVESTNMMYQVGENLFCVAVSVK
jgi:hypothetical protein